MVRKLSQLKNLDKQELFYIGKEIQQPRIITNYFVLNTI